MKPTAQWLNSKAMVPTARVRKQPSAASQATRVRLVLAPAVASIRSSAAECRSIGELENESSRVLLLSCPTA